MALSFDAVFQIIGKDYLPSPWSTVYNNTTSKA